MKRLEDMSLDELWRLFPIRLSAPDTRWRRIAAKEIRRIEKALGSSVLRISHVGSTAIDGICAKPIIDLIVEVPEYVGFYNIKDKIIGMGYVCMNETAERISFNRGYTVDGYADEVFHLHLRKAGDNDEVYFRDYLNRHPDIAKGYEALKVRLGQEFEYNRDAYTEAKTDFVRKYTALGKTTQN